ncbi:velum formation-related protein [Friedmanniomyces endolithicus]|nr:velum formation-related protein [Friedmanniomyces endolithicus]
MDQSRVMPVDNENESSAARETKDGKQLTYHLKVLQQPIRARACGAGAESSADRRPVDPPPIVELKIFDGENSKTDITFSMNANYFLFATLEPARPMAHGRVAEHKQQLTVLTGTPVAGMVYLDRPEPAGYFIFPDLSVRHEGKYRLGFSLYEESKDVKFDDSTDGGARATSPEDPCVTHRLEVKSEPFTVYSAKKFPGLTESTSLSRMVAEQGCRVRIRRDVRMRRRDPKSGKDWDDYEEETAQARSRMSSTPDTSSAYPTLPTPLGYVPISGRPRSASDASRHSLVHPVSRRPSLQELNQSYTQPFRSGTHTPQSGYVQSSPYGPSPSQLNQQPPLMQQPPMQPPPPQYPQQQPSHPPPPMPASASTQPGYYGYAPASTPVPHPQYAAPPSSYETGGRVSVDYSSHLPADYRRSSAHYVPLPPTYPPTYGHQLPVQYPQYMPTQQAYQPPPPQPYHATQHSHQPSYGSQDGYTHRASLPQPVQPPLHPLAADNTAPTRPSYEPSTALPPLRITTDLSGHIEPSPARTAPPPYTDTFYSATTESRKRQHGSVFRDSERYVPLRQGARPSDAYASHASAAGDAIEAADDADEVSGGDRYDASRMLTYPRAHGGWSQAALPPHSDE